MGFSDRSKGNGAGQAAWDRAFRGVAGVAVFAGLSLVGCGDDEATGDRDSGYGRGAAVPETRSCGEMCLRLAKCGVVLCNENYDTTSYDWLLDKLTYDCVSTCSEEAVQTKLTDDMWSCLFQSSCREILEHNACRTQTSYTCEPDGS